MKDFFLYLIFCTLFIELTENVNAQSRDPFPTDKELTELYRIREFALAEAKARCDIENTKAQLKAAFEAAGGSEEELKKAIAGMDAALERAKSKDPKVRAYQLGTATDLKTAMQLRVYHASKRDRASLGKMNATLLPDEDSLKKVALKEKVEQAVVDSLLQMYRRFTPEDPDDQEAWAELIQFRVDQKDIRVLPAKTEEIAQRKPAAKNFPNGAVEAAKTILKPKTTFYRVEFVEPGEELGVSYHLFYWDQANWKMLGPVWRATR